MHLVQQRNKITATANKTGQLNLLFYNSLCGQAEKVIWDVGMSEVGIATENESLGCSANSII